MKKFMKKLSAMLLACILCICAALPAMAAEAEEPKQGSITITKKDSTFDVYKVASAVSVGGGKFNYTPTADFAAFFTGENTMEAISKKVSDGLNMTTPSPSNFAQNADMTMLTADLKAFMDGKNIKTAYTLKSGTKTVVDLGWYLIVEKTSGEYTGTDADSAIGNGTRPNAAVASKTILVTVPFGETYDVAMYPKDDSATITKKIIENGSRVDTNSANMGDDVDYEITSTIPTYASDVDLKNVKYTITDTMSKGLTYNNDLVVKAGSTALTKGTHYTVTTTPDAATGGTKIVVDFKYATIAQYAEQGLTLTLSGKINEKANVGHTGNPNDVVLEFTNNPYESNSFNKIPDKVITYLWGIAVNKVDANDIKTDLAGAVFSLKDATNKVVAAFTYDAAGKVVPISANVTTNAEGMAYFTGLKDGTYRIVEEKAPEGYKILSAPVEVVITATKANENYTGAATYTVTNADKAASAVANITMDDNTVLFGVQIKNFPGLTLPSTGGVGTTMFYVIGGLFICVAAGVFIKLAVSKKTK